MLMEIRNRIREKVIDRLKEISHRESNYLYRKGKLDRENYISRMLYPQTWWMKQYLPQCLVKRHFVYKEHYFRNPLRSILTSLCRISTGHEKSDTEHGYGGGDFIDHHCRWCDKVIREPIEDSVWAQEGELSDLIAKMRNGQAPALEE